MKKKINYVDSRTPEEKKSDSKIKATITKTKSQKCLTCGRKMIEVLDSVTGTYTGHIWMCECAPNLRISKCS